MRAKGNPVCPFDMRAKGNPVCPRKGNPVCPNTIDHSAKARRLNQVLSRCQSGHVERGFGEEELHPQRQEDEAPGAKSSRPPQALRSRHLSISALDTSPVGSWVLNSCWATRFLLHISVAASRLFLSPDSVLPQRVSRLTKAANKLHRYSKINSLASFGAGCRIHVE
jgi:hypothetical protein